MIIIVINIKKGSGGMLLSDFALEPSENCNLIFLILLCWLYWLKLSHFSYNSNKSYIILKAF